VIDGQLRLVPARRSTLKPSAPKKRSARGIPNPKQQVSGNSKCKVQMVETFLDLVFIWGFGACYLVLAIKL